ncbi:hypothetical protein DY000_02003871 [Brassica cretica]|uniref:Uncharacterized protein n=1 Tax=Brassica cretica TaxID=69181 RepID=A0ABQ7BU99_BRACR|nr:hypothetical protein DY000_02003871 [Brassica cretica]
MYDCNGEHLASISVRRDLIVHDFAPGGSTWTIKALKFAQWLEQELLNSNIQMGRLFANHYSSLSSVTPSSIAATPHSSIQFFPFRSKFQSLLETQHKVPIFTVLEAFTASLYWVTRL